MERVDLGDASRCEDHTDPRGWCAVKDGIHYGLPRVYGVIQDLRDPELGSKEA